MAKIQIYKDYFETDVCYTDTGIGIGTGADIQYIGTVSASVDSLWSIPELITVAKLSTLPKSAITIHVGMHFYKNKGNKL